MVYMRKLESTVGLIGLLILFLTTTTNAAEYYTWVDENGVVNYAARSPQGYQAKYVTGSQRFGYSRGEADGASEAATPPVDTASPDQIDDKAFDAQIAGERARINQEIAAAKKSNCAIAKRNLAQLEAYARIKVRDDDGSEKVLTETEKSTRVNQAKQTIRENCTG